MNKTLRFFSGRMGQWKRLSAAFRNEDRNNPPLWVHCASLGEFEQGRPIMEAYRQKYPGKKILLTFFSPSGYEIRKNTPLADHVFYLPLDTPRNARKFLDLVRPVAAIFVKYEFWYFYLTALKKRNIPTYLVSARFRPDQPFFKKYGAPFRRMLRCFDHLFVQDGRSLDLLASLSKMPLPVTMTGDTRFDRVVSVAASDNTPELFKELVREPVLIAGSTWPRDEEILEHWAGEFPEWQLVIAPHELHPSHLSSIARLFAKWDPVFFSAATKGRQPKILVIDTIGILSSLYRYGTVCYIGGGFNPSGIHNTLEAAVYGKPLLFGPNYEKFGEACDLVSLGAAISFRDRKTCLEAIRPWIEDPSLREKAGKAGRNYVLKNTGATRLILEKMAARVQ